MQSLKNVFVSLLAGFLGAMLALHFFQLPGVSAKDNTPLDSLTTKHLVVTEDIMIKSDSLRPVVLTNSSGGSFEITDPGATTKGGNIGLHFATGSGAKSPDAILTASVLSFTQGLKDESGHDKEGTVAARVGPLAGVVVEQTLGPGAMPTFSANMSASWLRYSFNDVQVANSKNCVFSNDGINGGTCRH